MVQLGATVRFPIAPIAFLVGPDSSRPPRAPVLGLASAMRDARWTELARLDRSSTRSPDEATCIMELLYVRTICKWTIYTTTNVGSRHCDTA